MKFREPQVNLFVEDVERSVAFYRDHLGFAETYRTPKSGPPDHVELRLGGLVLGFATHSAARDHHGLSTGGKDLRGEVVVWCDDADEAWNYLIEHGARPLSEPHTFLNGTLRSGWLLDPDGHVLSVTCSLKAT